jgi:hypothetical protein
MEGRVFRDQKGQDIPGAHVDVGQRVIFVIHILNGHVRAAGADK